MRGAISFRQRIAAAALLFGCSICPAAVADATVNIAVHADRKASYTIPRTICGTFLEPIGNSTYNGLWAEILQNPSLEENLWSASKLALMIEEQPSLGRASQLGLPMPWEPLDPKQANRYEPRWGNAANSWRSLSIFGLSGAETGIKQQVFLPVQRELHYKGSIYAKRLTGRGRIEVSLRGRSEAADVFASAALDPLGSEWKKYTFDLTLPPGKLLPLEPADFVISVKGDERVQIDQVSLIPADALDGLDPDMVRMAKELDTPLIRFGGNFTSAYHWRDGVGPPDRRVSTLNIAWGIPEYNQFGTDEFLHFCKLIGAQPQIALNLGSGTPEEAADWVRYVDQHWTTHSGLLWELGNELWGNWNLGYPSLDEIAERTRIFSEAVRKTDPEARLIATGQDPDVYKQWNAAQLSNPAGTFDFLSTHFVVTTDRVELQRPTPDLLASAAFALPVELGRRLRQMQQQINEAPQFRGKAHIAFTEWLDVCCRNQKNADAPRFDNMGGAIGTAGFFNMLLGNADIVPISDMTGIVEFAGIWKKRGRVYAAPSYYAFQMYSSAQLDTPVAVQTDSPVYSVTKGITRLPDIPNVPYLDVAAVLNRSGDRLTLFCVNRHLDRDLPAIISIDGFTPAAAVTVETLFSDSIYDVNDEVRPEAVTPSKQTAEVHGTHMNFTFRHESVTRMELRKK